MKLLALWVSRAIGVISLSVLITLVVTNIQARRYAIDHAHSSQECKHYSHNLPEPKLIYWFRGTLADANAYWTAIASLVALIALWGIYEQIRSTEGATNQTKKSLDAYVSTERAYIMLASIEFEDPAPAAGENKRTIQWTFQNVGRGPGVVIEVAHNAEPIEMGATVPLPESLAFHSRGTAYQPLGDGDSMNTWNRAKGIDGAMPPCADPSFQDGSSFKALVDCKKRLVFSGYVVYHSMAEGAYYRRYFTAIWNADRHKPGQGNFSVYRKPGYNYEVRLTEKEATADLPPVPDAVVNA